MESAMPDSMTCGRCGMTSANPDDIAAVYCGHCHAMAAPYIRGGHTAPLPWSRPGAAPLDDIRASMQAYYDTPAQAAGQQDLTPEVLLTGGRWAFDGFDGDEAVFRFSPLAGPGVSSWRPDASLGAMTADWTHGDMMRLRLSREVIERAAARLAGEVPVRRLMQPACTALLQVLKAMRPAGLLTAQEPDTWHCERCGRFMQAPPGRELVLCGYHEAPERMARVQLTGLHPPVLSASVQFADVEFRAFQHQMDERIAAMVLSGPPAIDSLTDEQACQLEQQIRASYGPGVLDENPVRVGSHTGDSSAARTRREHHQSLQRVNRDRRRQVLDDAEAMIARLDGEGYGVRAKAEQVDAATVSIPELPMFDHDQGGNAARWFPGDPVL